MNQLSKNGLRPISSRFKKAFFLWSEHDGGELSAAVAFCASLSVLPIFMLTFLLIDAVADHMIWAENLHSNFLITIEEESSPQFRGAFEETLSETRNNIQLKQPLVVLWLLASSVLIFAQVDRGLERIWGYPSKIGLLSGLLDLLRNRLRASLLLIGLGGVMASMLVLTIMVHAIERSPFLGLKSHPWLGGISHVVVHLVTNTFFFSLLFVWFSKRTVAMRDALQGACLLAVSWELGRQLMGSLVIRNYSDFYGVTGSFLVILLWIYYASVMLFFSASYVRVLGDER